MAWHGRNYFLGMQKIAKIWAKALLFLAGVKVKTAGLENIKEEPHIFAVNHQSMFDIMIVLASLPLPFHFIAKESLFKIPVFGWVMSWGGYFPINRVSHTDARRTMDDITKHILEEKASILIYPEGTRSLDGHLLPFKKGCAALGHQTGATIYPVGIQNSGRIAVKGSLRIHPQTVSLKIGAGIKLQKLPLGQVDPQTLNVSTQKIKAEIEKLI